MTIKPETRETVRKGSPVICTAIVCIAVIECYAISKGINGKVLTFSIAIVAGLAGYKFGDIKETVKKLLK